MTKKIIIGIIFVVTLFVGFQVFAAGPRSEVGQLQGNVQNLESAVEAPADAVILRFPPRSAVVRAVENSSQNAGITVEEINFLDNRAEVVTESDPASVAKFARDISTNNNLQAVAIDGSLLPQSVVTLEPRN